LLLNTEAGSGLPGAVKDSVLGVVSGYKPAFFKISYYS
jgi:hypothetical protein